MRAMQTTLRSSADFRGTGLHSGRPVRLRVSPAPVDHGIVFRRTDIAGADATIPARWDLVVGTPLCTRLVNPAGVSVSTVEHLMAALAGLGIHNALVEVDNAELPILDGSAAPFVRGMLARGLVAQDAPLTAIEVLRPVEVRQGSALARLAPSRSLVIDFEIDFDDGAIGRQRRSLNIANGAFVRTLCDSRTFCRQADVEAMHAAGLALGGTYANAVVFDGDRVLSPGGLRHDDEPVRHKMLDALGDLALAGLPILGHYQGVRAGHALTNDLLHALFAQADAFDVVECDGDTAARLPGAGVHWDEIPDVA